MKKLNFILLAITCLLFCVSVAAVILGSSQKPKNNDPDPKDDPANDTYIKITDFDFKGIKVVIEPELAAAVEEPAEVSHDSAASGNKCIEIKEGKGKPPKVGGKVECGFAIPADGTYRLWGRRWWMDTCGNSFTFVIKGEQPVDIVGTKNKADKNHIFGDDASYNPVIGLAWKWTKGQKYKFKKGTYIIIIKNREDGVKLDQIMFVEIKDPTDEYPYIPYEAEKSQIPDTTQ